MVKVAVSGGTSGAGLHIIQAILATRKHEVVVLSRQPSSPQVAALGAQLVTVSYDNPSSLIDALAGVHTVIVTINGFDEASTVKPQLALLDAAIKAGVKRFAPSEFLTCSHADDPIQLFSLQWPVEEAVAKSGLEYTFFENGIFMNYLASGTEGLGFLCKPYRFLFNVEECKAILPGDGTAYIVYTRVEDVARFVAASLELGEWPVISQMQGERLTLNEILRIVENIRGRKFDVTYISQEELEQRLETYGPEYSRAKLWDQWYLSIIKDGSRWGFEGSNVNESFPDLPPTGLEHFLTAWWPKA